MLMIQLKQVRGEDGQAGTGGNVMLGLEPRDQAAASVLTHSHNHFSRILTLDDLPRQW